MRLATGRDVEVLNFLNDHSRLLLACAAFHRVTGPAVTTTFKETVNTYGIPASVLSDNGMVFTTRFAGGRGGRNNGFETEPHRLGIVQKNSFPNHSQTCGKVERFHQTLEPRMVRVVFYCPAFHSFPIALAKLQLQFGSA